MSQDEKVKALRAALHSALNRIKRDYHEIVCPALEYPDEHQCDGADEDPVVNEIRAALMLGE